jgi:hypothetical protein
MAPSFKDAMKAAATKKESKSKSKTPQVQRDDLSDPVDKWLEADKMEKDSKALKEQVETVALPEFEAERLKACQRDGEFHSSIKVNGKVTVSVQHRYSSISPDTEAELKKVVGDRYGEFFKAKSSVELTKEAMQDETFLGKVMEAVGADFAKFFKVTDEITVTEAFHEQSSTNSVVAEMAKKLIGEGLIKPAKPSIKRA